MQHDLSETQATREILRHFQQHRSVALALMVEIDGDDTKCRALRIEDVNSNRSNDGISSDQHKRMVARLALIRMVRIVNDFRNMRLEQRRAANSMISDPFRGASRRA